MSSLCRYCLTIVVAGLEMEVWSGENLTSVGVKDNGNGRVGDKRDPCEAMPTTSPIDVLDLVARFHQRPFTSLFTGTTSTRTNFLSYPIYMCFL
jgi:hypothetical protein